jgi:hypothetical protein
VRAQLGEPRGLRLVGELSLRGEIAVEAARFDQHDVCSHTT